MKTLFLLFGLFIIFLTMPKDVLACSCMYPPADTEELLVREMRQTKAVFTGEVIQVRRSGFWGNTTVKVKIKESWKGIDSTFINIKTNKFGSMCGIPFEVSDKYLFFAYEAGKNKLSVGLCTSTMEIERADKLLYLLNNLKNGIIPNAILTGTVYSQTGAVVSDITVKLKDKSCKTYESSTNADGVYKFSVPAGNYSIELKAVNYEKFKINNYPVMAFYKGWQAFDFNLSLKQPQILLSNPFIVDKEKR